MSTDEFDFQSLIDLQKQYILDLAAIDTGDTNLGLSQTQLTTLNQQLDDLHTAFNRSNAGANDVLLGQQNVYDILQTEATRINDQMQKIEDAKSGQQRMIAINNSYSSKYSAWNEMLYIIIFTCIFIIILHFEYKMFNILPEFIRYILYIIIIGVGIFMTLLVIVKIASRDKMDFNKIDPPPPNITSAEAIQRARDADIASGNLMGLINTCRGAECCSDGTTYDAATNSCLIDPAEGFTNYTPYDPNVRLNKRPL